MIKQLSYIFSGKEKFKIVMLFIVAIIGSGLECLGVGVFMPFVNVLMDSQVIFTNEYLNKVYTAFGFQSVAEFLTAMTFGIIVIFILKNFYLMAQKFVIYQFSYSTQRKISLRLLRAYMSEPYTFHLNKNISELQRSVQEDADLFTKAIIHFMELVVEITVCMALGIYLFDVSKSMTVVIVGLLICCVTLFTTISKRYTKELGKQCQAYKAKLYQWMNQSLGGIKEVKVLNRENFFINSYEKYYRKYVRGLKISRFLAVLPKYIVEMVSMSGLLLAIIIKMNYGRADFVKFIPQLAAFAVAAFRLLPSVGRINEHTTNILYAAPSIELIYHDLKEVENIEGEFEQDDALEWKFNDKVEIYNVCYHYPDTDKNVVNYANFSINRGETVALIGESGAGKTTMADIILGLLPPQYGKIKVDNLDIFKNLNTWHRNIGYIPQAIYLSDDTIRNNVAFGIEEQEINEEAVTEALSKAQLLEFVDGLTLGLDTFVGDRGVRLSGGQRQRVGIARALYHNPDILIMDEATSALDNDTEAAVMEAIEHLRGDKTIIIIAHRLTTIKNADVIYAVEDNEIVKKNKDEVVMNRKVE